MLLLAAAVYQLVEGQLNRLRCVISAECEGCEREAELLLLDLLRRDRPAHPTDSIVFAHVDKKSLAHKKSLRVYRGEDKADRVGTEELVAPLMEKKRE